MAKSTNRYFQFTGSAKKAVAGRTWYPAADVYQTPDGWVIKVELAGVSRADVVIDIAGNELRISGSRKDKSCSAGVSYHQMEITYSSFEKTLRFPKCIEGSQVEHTFEDGLLIISLKRVEQVA
jgi:HSP20 family protein